MSKGKKENKAMVTAITIVIAIIIVCVLASLFFSDVQLFNPSGKAIEVPKTCGEAKGWCEHWPCSKGVGLGVLDCGMSGICCTEQLTCASVGGSCSPTCGRGWVNVGDLGCGWIDDCCVNECDNLNGECQWWSCSEGYNEVGSCGTGYVCCAFSSTPTPEGTINAPETTPLPGDSPNGYCAGVNCHDISCNTYSEIYPPLGSVLEQYTSDCKDRLEDSCNSVDALPGGSDTDWYRCIWIS